MSLSVMIPGNEFTENVTVSSMRTAMTSNGSKDGDQPIRPFAGFLRQVSETLKKVELGQRSHMTPEQAALHNLFGDRGVGAIMDAAQSWNDAKVDQYHELGERFPLIGDNLQVNFLFSLTDFAEKPLAKLGLNRYS